jgi:hypothetical protein
MQSIFSFSNYDDKDNNIFDEFESEEPDDLSEFF